jgi:hypothetical protein
MAQRITAVSIKYLAPLGIAFSALALLPGQAPQGPSQAKQAPARDPLFFAEDKRVPRSPLFFREEWRNPAGGEYAVTQENVTNPNLELKLYGAGKVIQLTGSAQEDNNPVHVWTGLCESNCALALRDKGNYADLTGLARIRWNTKVSGFQKIRPLLKLADGTWLVGDHTDGSRLDWQLTEFSIAEVRWRRLDINRVVAKGDWVQDPDLTKVDEIGFTDLMAGSGRGKGGWSDVAQIEVYGKPVKR